MYKSKQTGFSLIELMVSMALGLVVVLGITQIFVGAKQTYVAQSASARMQEDARYALTRMTQELRMAGMFGCISLGSGSITGVPVAFDSPITWTEGSSTLALITANVASGSAASTNADWTLTTDCRTTGTVVAGEAVAPAAGFVAFPIRQIEYQYDAGANTLSVQNGGTGGFQPLISGVSAFDVSFGLAAAAADANVSGAYIAGSTNPDAALIRSVRISLTLTDAGGQVRDQSYSVVVALRNRIL
jgi:type IV pilus assembly protein PilW